MMEAISELKKEAENFNSLGSCEIWFHGTCKESAESILREGFHIGTWFARHLEDSLAFGGPYVFEVALEVEKISADATWQVHTLGPIPPERIVSLVAFTKKILMENPDLRREVFQSNADGSIDGFAGKVEEHRWFEPRPTILADASDV